MSLELGRLLPIPAMPRMSLSIIEDPSQIPPQDALRTTPKDITKEFIIGAFDPTRRKDRKDLSPRGRIRTTFAMFTEVARKHEMENAYRIANGVRLRLLDTNYGIFHTQARENPHTSDHGFEHDRRHEKYIRASVEHSPEFSLKEENIRIALALFSSHHDADELNTTYENLSKTSENRLKAKDAHDFAGALQTLALANRLQAENNFTPEKTREIIGLASLMQMLHHHKQLLHGAYEQTLTPDGNKAYELTPDGKRMLHGEELLKRLSEGVDLFSLSPKQISELTTHFKQQANPRFVTDSTPHGLHPLFEQDFKDELNTIDADDESLLSNASSETRKEFVTATKIAIFADQLDMLIPIEDAILRMFALDVSKGRPLYIDDVDKARERILGNVSTPSEESNPFEDADLWRKMWELRTLSERITDPELLKSKFIRELTAEVVMKSKKALKEIGSALMTGDPAVVQNLIDKVEHGQLITLAEKMQRKTNRQVLTYTPGVENPEKYLERVVDALISSSDVKSQNYGQLLSQKISVQKDLQQKLWDAITDGGKYNRQGIKGMMQFAPEAIAQFNDLVDELISDPKEFRYQDEVYTIPRRTLRRLQKETEKGAPITTPYDSYLTSQTFDAAPIRTWAHTSQIMKEAA